MAFYVDAQAFHERVESSLACAVRHLVGKSPPRGQAGQSGNLAALRLCLDRIVPPRKDRPLFFEMPCLEKAEDAAKAMAAIAAAVANGSLTLSEAAEVSKIVETFVHALEATELERRLRAVEERK